MKCAQDPVYFIKNYVQIVNVDKGLVPFEMWDFQEDIVDLVQTERYVICKMPRQVGKTTTVASILLHYVLFNENYSIAILANKLSQAREILSRIQMAFEHLPKWLQQGVVEWNKGFIELANGSKILASATSSSAIRGTSQNCIAGDSTITLRVGGQIIDLPISSLDANSSKYNYNDLGVIRSVHQQQIYKLVQQHCIDADTGRDIGGASYSSEEHGRIGRNEQSRETIDPRTSACTSSADKDDSWTGSAPNEVCLCEDAERKAGSVGADGSYAEETLPDRLETYRCDQTENQGSKHRAHSNGRNKAQAVSSEEGQDTSSHTGVECCYISGVDRKEEDGGTLQQDKQESREDQKDCRKTSWDEKVTGIKAEDECCSQGPSALEQRSEKIEVLTTEGFKQFTGLRVIPNKQTVNVTLVNGYNITCTGDHKIQTTDGWVCASDLTAKHCVVTNSAPSNVISVSHNGCATVYDILNVKDTHSFIANGISVSNCIYLDEFAFVPNNMQEEFFMSVYPTISSGKSSKVVITSTPNGLNMFYKLWKDSEEGRNDYKRVDVHWSQVPGRDQAWKEEVIRNTSEEQFRQEYDCVDGNTLVTIRCPDTGRTKEVAIEDLINKGDCNFFEDYEAQE